MLFGQSLLAPYILAALCRETYKELPKPKIGSWLLLSTSDFNHHGYRGVAYVHSTQNLVVIAHGSTDANLLGHLLGDVFLSPEILKSGSQEEARKFSERVRAGIPAYWVVETGHSLGGFHAEMNAGHLGGYAMTFESPGTKEILEAEGLMVNPTHFVSFFSNPNVVNTAKRHVGELYRIYTYHVDARGYHVDKLIRRAQVAKSVLLSGKLSQFTLDLAKAVCERQFQYYTLGGFLREMHPQVGYPWLMRRMRSWPSLIFLLEAKLPQRDYSEIDAKGDGLQGFSTVSSSQLLYPEHILENRAYEKAFVKIPGFELGNWVKPDLFTTPHSLRNAYQLESLGKWDKFYEERGEREAFIQALGIAPNLVNQLPFPEVVAKVIPAGSQASPSDSLVSHVGTISSFLPASFRRKKLLPGFLKPSVLRPYVVK